MEKNKYKLKSIRLQKDSKGLYIKSEYPFLPISIFGYFKTYNRFATASTIEYEYLSEHNERLKLFNMFVARYYSDTSIKGIYFNIINDFSIIDKNEFINEKKLYLTSTTLNLDKPIYALCVVDLSN